MRILSLFIFFSSLLLAVTCSFAQYALQPTAPGQKAIRVELPIFNHKELAYAHQLLPDSGLKPEALPKVRSKKNNVALTKATKLLRSGKLKDAAALASSLYKKEPNNPFVLKLYGDVLLKQGKRKESRRIYDLLFYPLYKTSTTSASAKIDLWFKQLYWDLGGLYVENLDWVAATEALSFALMTFDKKTPLLQQEKALEFLAKAYFNLKDFEQAKYFAEIVLIQNPENKEVQAYISQ